MTSSSATPATSRTPAASRAPEERSPRLSVVIPAHNEEQVIGRCIEHLLRGAEPGEFEVVVVPNGCDDRTAEVAASFGDAVTVVDSPVASKRAALSAGDEAATVFPRMYVDADILVSAEALRAVADVLDRGEADVAAPAITFDLSGRPWPVRAYYEIWGKLPYITDDLVGSGFYAMNRETRERFTEFPDADDFYVRSLVPAGRRRSVRDHTFTIHPPYTLKSLVRIRSRMFASNVRDRELFDGDNDEVRGGQLQALRDLARSPRNWPALGAYVGIVLAAKAQAAVKNRWGDTAVWERDESARRSSAA
ncbi:MAG: glycosyltransferase [Actinomycetota bacterium]|nr:glycosyltransferase [Actinomycetota bacterium]